MSERDKTIASHGALAAVFFFVLQKFALGRSVGTAPMWAAAGTSAAALLAWQQTSR